MKVVRSGWGVCCAVLLLIGLTSTHSSGQCGSRGGGSWHRSHGRWTQGLPLGDHHALQHFRPRCAPGYGYGYGFGYPRVAPAVTLPSIYYYPFKSSSGRVTPPRTPLQQTVARLMSTDAKVSSAAREKLFKNRPDVDQLVSWMSSPDASLRAGAVEVLGWDRDASAAHSTQLARALRDEKYLVRQRAAWALGRIGPRAKSVVPSLCDALADSNTDVRVYVQDALVQMGDASVDTLVAAIATGNADLRNQAADVLARIGEPAVDELLPLLADERAEVRSCAVFALGKIGPAQSHPLMGARLADLARTDPNGDVRYYASDALNRMQLSAAAPSGKALVHK